MPPAVQALAAVLVVFTLWLGLNWIYQVSRKPSELFFPVSGALYKTPHETWQEYGDLFRAHATAVMTPDLLAALAQIEGSGNPLARTYWRWSLRRTPLELYRPASSAVGMYQITDGTFAQARRYCIHRHAVAEEGPWHDARSCWFNSLYLRTLPAHATELTAAYLDRSVANALKRMRIADAATDQKQTLAIVIHLCGAGAGDGFARRGFQTAPGQRCGAHDLRGYLARVEEMARRFRAMTPDE